MPAPHPIRGRLSHRILFKERTLLLSLRSNSDRRGKKGIGTSISLIHLFWSQDLSDDHVIHVTVDQQQMFWLERSSGKMGYMLSARELSIAFAHEESEHWHWVSLPDSRFSEVAELRAVSWLEVRGRMDCGLLSANTEYRVVFVLKFGERSFGWKELPIKFWITTPDGETSEVAIKFSVTTPYEQVFEMSRALLESRRRRIHRDVNDSFVESEDDDGDGPRCDADYCCYVGGWLEVVAGEFSVREEENYYCGDNDSAASAYIEFCMEEVDSGRWKGGLLIDGVKIEPKYA